MLTLNVDHPDGVTDNTRFIVGEQMNVNIAVASDFTYEDNFKYVNRLVQPEGKLNLVLFSKNAQHGQLMQTAMWLRLMPMEMQ